MSFLTPLYLLAGLAVGLPILFHLIRKTPKGRQVFSSLMFLEPSPPRVSKRSRIEDWLLLLLRAFAVCLLAIAFARPFLRTQDSLEGEENPGQRIVILIDTSASMQRPGFWKNVRAEVENILIDLRPSDSLSLLSFDSEVVRHLSFTEWQALTPEVRNATVLKEVDQLSPGSFGTELGKAILTAVDLLEDSTDEQVTEKILAIISDFQTGSHREALNGYQWPENVSVSILNVDQKETHTNASIQVIANESSSDDSVRLRMNNTYESESEQFEIGWVDEFTDLSEGKPQLVSPVSVYIPPGQSKVIHAPERPDQIVSQRLRVTGDQQDFDNTCFVARRKPWEVNIVYLGKENGADPDSLRFFLDPVFPSTANRTVTITNWTPEFADCPIEKSKLTLLIIGSRLTPSQREWIKTWLVAGGQILLVATSPEQAAEFYELTNIPEQSVKEGSVADYAMLNSVDFTHPIFAPFDDPRFADFSKLRFWKHRQFELADQGAVKFWPRSKMEFQRFLKPQ